MADKKAFATRIDIESLKALKHLSVDAEKTVSSLIEEAVKDLLKKYAQKPK
jgi:Antitoxin-like ribbon-helix-helix